MAAMPNPTPARTLTADIVAVGSELLTPFKTDTNSLTLSAALGELGIRVRAKHVVGDDEETLRSVLREALAQSALVILTGGLGPTEDDVTRAAVAGLLGLPLRQDDALLAALEARFARHGMRMPAINRRQALVPRGAVALPNRAGTAPGLVIAQRGKTLVLLPGPPRELAVVWEKALLHVRALVRGRRRVIHTKTLRIVGLPESHVDELTSPIYRRARGVSTTILFGEGGIQLHLSAEAATLETARRKAGALAVKLRKVLGRHVYGEDGDTLESVVVAALRARGERVALAESCTGGLIGHRLTRVPGASDVLDLAIVCYANWAKQKQVGVRAATLRAHGAVSEPTAREMAEGIRKRGRAAWGVAVTGIAGPTGGTPDKPVGTTWVAVASARATASRRFVLPGDRAQIKLLASQAALEMLRRAIEDAG